MAVRPPPEVIDAIADLPTRALRGVKYTRRAQWHVTLRFLGDCQRHRALEAFAALRAPKATVTLGPDVALLGNRVVMLAAAGLDDVAAEVATAFADVGEPTEREFAGHLTLARLKGRPLRDPGLVSVLGEPFAMSFDASEVELIKTELSPEGATHTLVATQDLLS